MLVQATIKLLTNKNKLSKEYLFKNVIQFLKSLMASIIYVVLINMIFMTISERIVYVNEWLVRITCMFISWLVARYNVLKKIIY